MADGIVTPAGNSESEFVPEVFGRLTTLGPGTRKNYAGCNRWVVECLCSCGKEKTVREDVLRKGEIKSCGCMPRGPVPKPYAPKVFGRLATIGPNFKKPVGNRYVYYAPCLCECGKTVTVQVSALHSGKTKSCGCLGRELTQRRNTKHGAYESPLYHIWINMIARCYDAASEAYARYGGRGIKVCQRWLDPAEGIHNFSQDIGPRPSASHTLDRKNNNGDYEPDNCRWATKVEQSRNRRTNLVLTHAGKSQCASAWAEELGFSTRNAIVKRLRAGWSVEKALTTPPLSNGNKRSTL